MYHELRMRPKAVLVTEVKVKFVQAPGGRGGMPGRTWTRNMPVHFQPVQYVLARPEGDGARAPVLARPNAARPRPPSAAGARGFLGPSPRQKRQLHRLPQLLEAGDGDFTAPPHLQHTPRARVKEATTNSWLFK